MYTDAEMEMKNTAATDDTAKRPPRTGNNEPHTSADMPNAGTCYRPG